MARGGEAPKSPDSVDDASISETENTDLVNHDRSRAPAGSLRNVTLAATTFSAKVQLHASKREQSILIFCMDIDGQCAALMDELGGQHVSESLDPNAMSSITQSIHEPFVQGDLQEPTAAGTPKDADLKTWSGGLMRKSAILAQNRSQALTKEPAEDVADTFPSKRRKVMQPTKDQIELDVGKSGENDIGEEEEDFPGVKFEVTPVRVDSLHEVYFDIFKKLQQKGLKHVIKAWIRACHPAKQGSFPYNGGKVKGEFGWDPENPGRATAPDYWPSQYGWKEDRGCRHKEPDHLHKPERLILAVWLLRAGSQFKDAKFPIATLEKNTSEITIDHPNEFHADAKELLRSLYLARREEIAFQSGAMDPDTTIFVLMPPPAPPRTRSTPKRRKSRKPVRPTSVFSVALDKDPPSISTPSHLSDQADFIKSEPLEKSLSRESGKSFGHVKSKQRLVKRAGLLTDPIDKQASTASSSNATNPAPHGRKHDFGKQDALSETSIEEYSPERSLSPVVEDKDRITTTRAYENFPILLQTHQVSAMSKPPEHSPGSMGRVFASPSLVNPTVTLASEQVLSNNIPATQIEPAMFHASSTPTYGNFGGASYQMVTHPYQTSSVPNSMHNPGYPSVVSSEFNGALPVDSDWNSLDYSYSAFRDGSDNKSTMTGSLNLDARSRAMLQESNNGNSRIPLPVWPSEHQAMAHQNCFQHRQGPTSNNVALQAFNMNEQDAATLSFTSTSSFDSFNSNEDDATLIPYGQETVDNPQTIAGGNMRTYPFFQLGPRGSNADDAREQEKQFGQN